MLISASLRVATSRARSTSTIASPSAEMRLTRKLLFEAANVMLSRTSQALALKDSASAIGQRSGFWEARVALARKLAVILHRMWIDGRGFDLKVTAMPRYLLSELPPRQGAATAIS